MSLASVAAQQAATTAANATAATGAAAPAKDALSTLSGNFQNFLSLLMTQLKNQDPTSPLDTNQFTSQLVQFTGVEQQINTNSSLTQLIQLTQGGQVLQSSALVGKQVEVTSDRVPLQKGVGDVRFTTASAQPVEIVVTNDAGVRLRDDTVRATKGPNDWKWDGTDSRGNRVADGSYKVAVTGINVDGTTAAVPFTVVGTATSVQKSGSTLQLQLGALGVEFSKVQSVDGAAYGG